MGSENRQELAAAARIVRGLLYFVIVGALWLGLIAPAFHRRRFAANPPLA